uniref:HTH_Tnp_Tc3_1 domain-containing protein n=1 Tax=Caenorhabditis japonica TaxID=281687 RepID=A0A8R1J0Y4_CAEJA
MGLASTLYSEEQAQLDIMIQLGFSTLQLSRRITRLRCCVRNYVRDTMAHGSAKPTGRPRILNDRDNRSNTLVFLEFVTCKMNSMDYQDTPERNCLLFQPWKPQEDFKKIMRQSTEAHR